MLNRLVGGSRAFAPGSRTGLLVVGATLVVAVVAVALAWTATRGGEASAASRYGQLPAWLPKAKVTTGRVLHASAELPRLAIEGDSVSLRLQSGRAIMTAIGPAVPEEGRFPVPPTSPCTFTVTIRGSSGSVPLQPGAFTILDELGNVHHPRVSLASGAPLPTRVAAGRTISLTVRDVLPTGGGRLRFAPERTRPIASWDFDVEID